MRDQIAAHRIHRHKEITVFARARKQFRSWMFIYAGLVAAIILSAPPVNPESRTRAEGGQLPAAASAPLLRRDI
jgi:hypothetical protein